MKKSIHTILIMCVCLGLGQISQAQSIVRAVLCSTGKTWMSSGGGLTATFGQCPGCTTLDNDTSIVTQGFQQPTGDNCLDLSSFEVQAINANCGTTFNFTFTGMADASQATFEWDFGAGAFPQTSNLANPQGVAFDTTGKKTVRLKVTTPDCQRISMLDVQVNALGFSSNPTPSATSCKGGQDGKATLEFTGGEAPFSVAWSNSSASENLDGVAAGTYSFTVTDAIGCTSIGEASIGEPADTVSANLSVSNDSCGDIRKGKIVATAAGGTPPFSFAWSDGQASETAQGLGNQAYSVTVTDSKGCTTRQSAEVGLFCETGAGVFLTPNGDGQNDAWVISDISLFPGSEVKIFNRWGGLVFSAKNYGNDWTGTNQSGEPLPSGAYFFVIELNDGENTIRSGSVTIIR